MMRDLSDFSKKPSITDDEIEIEMSCSHCMEPIILAKYLKREKILIAYCDKKHETRVEGFSFI